MKNPHDIPELDLPEPLRPYAELWLMCATANLSPDAKIAICAEIECHCREVYERFIDEGKEPEDAASRTIFSLGSRYEAMRAYQKTYLTLPELDALEKVRAQKTDGILWELFVALGITLCFARGLLTLDPQAPIFELLLAWTTYKLACKLVSRSCGHNDSRLVLGQCYVSMLATGICVAVLLLCRPSFDLAVCVFATLSLALTAIRMQRIVRKLSFLSPLPANGQHTK